MSQETLSPSAATPRKAQLPISKAQEVLMPLRTTASGRSDWQLLKDEIRLMWFSQIASTLALCVVVVVVYYMTSRVLFKVGIGGVLAATLYFSNKRSMLRAVCNLLNSVNSHRLEEAAERIKKLPPQKPRFVTHTPPGSLAN